MLKYYRELLREFSEDFGSEIKQCDIIKGAKSVNSCFPPC